MVVIDASHAPERGNGTSGYHRKSGVREFRTVRPDQRQSSGRQVVTPTLSITGPQPEPVVLANVITVVKPVATKTACRPT